MRDAIRNAATAVGVITGAGTIVGWIVSSESPAVVAGTAVGLAGMCYAGGGALVSFGIAILPPRTLKRLEDEGLTKATFRARAFFFGCGCVFAAFFVGLGTDPLDSTWIVLGAVALGIVAYVAVNVHRNSSTKRGTEFRECPDCAETIKTRARVCRYCGYRFALSPPVPTLTGPTLAQESQPRRTPAPTLPTAEDVTANRQAPDVHPAGPA